MNNFIYENKTKVYFGKGSVKEHLSSLLKKYGDTVMLAYGGGSIKKNGIYKEIIAILTAGGLLPGKELDVEWAYFSRGFVYGLIGYE